MSVNTTDPMIGRLIDGRYQVRSRIARGGMATVYLATDLRLERRVAVKVMHGHLADDSSFKERFIQEARSAARLAHPNVVNVFDQGQDADSAYLVMEYLPGITLRDLLQEYGSLTSEQTIDITEAVLAGLAAAHKAGIVHRDLKPENVLLADDGRIKIGDFGLARAASANTATGAALLGTIAYLSPELVTRGVADTRSDIYAVGIMMYEMLVGEQPFRGEQPMQIAYQHAHDAVPTPSVKNSKVPAELDELVLWATTRDPEQRPRDASAMLEELRVTESLLKTALPTGTTTAQRTVVMPAAPTAPRQSTAETQVLGRRSAAVAPATTVLPGHEVSDSTAALAVSSRKRGKRGGVLVAIIVVLALIAGGAGWYFGLGPGAKVTIPESIAGLAPDDARAQLTELGLTVAEATGTAASPTIPVGAVADTDPALGSSVAKGGEVTLLISSGPAELPFTLTQGMTQEDAETAIAEAPWTAGDPILRFDPAIPEGSVIDVLADDGATSLLGAATYGEQRTLTLVVSAGALPDVATLPFDQAVSTLAEVEVTATRGSEDYSDTVAEGSVIGIEGDTAAVTPGSSVTLQISRGQPPVQIPDVEGMVWSKAEAALTDAGLVITFKNGISESLARNFPNVAVVSNITPDAGETVRRGDSVSVTLQANG